MDHHKRSYLATFNHEHIPDCILSDYHVSFFRAPTRFFRKTTLFCGHKHLSKNDMSVGGQRTLENYFRLFPKLPVLERVFPHLDAGELRKNRNASCKKGHSLCTCQIQKILRQTKNNHAKGTNLTEERKSAYD